MKPVLDWIKSNVVIVIVAVVMLGLVIALPIFAGSMNADVEDSLKNRVSKFSEMANLEKTNVQIPDGSRGETRSESILINQQFLDQYERVTKLRNEDATKVLEAALAHNRKGRDVFDDRVLPGPMSLAQREELPRVFYTAFTEAHDDLLEEVGAGSPPSIEELAERLEQQESRFRSSMLAKAEGEALDDEEAERLEQELTKVRLNEYSQAAERIKFYADTDSMALPMWDVTSEVSEEEMFSWQWLYWIHEDILRGLATANTQSSSVTTGPLKRVVSLMVSPEVGPSAGAGGGGRGGNSRGGNSSAPQASAPNPKAEAPRDYSVSLTGRLTNPLYDVRLVDLELIVSATRYPVVLDALAKQNFMTVLDLSLQPADPYAEIAQGYYYGNEPVYRMNIKLETIWLRSWTSEFMPDAVKQLLGVPVTPPAGATGG